MATRTEERLQFIGVIFDCVGVCLKDGQKEALPDLEALIGVEAKRLQEAMGGAVREDYTTAKLDHVNYWTSVIHDRLQIPLITVRQRVAEKKKVSLEEVTAEYLANEFERIISEKYEPIPEVVNLLSQLKKAGYWCGMISNTPKERGEYWLRHFSFFQTLFDRINFSFSNDPPIRKPEGMKALVDNLISGANIRPENLVYVDDKFENVESAVSPIVGITGGIHVVNIVAETKMTNPKIVMATIETLGAALKEGYRFRI